MLKRQKGLRDHIQTKKTNYSAIGCPDITCLKNNTNNYVSKFTCSHTVKYISFIKKSPLQQNARRDWKRFLSPQKIMFRFIGKAYRVRFKENIFFFKFHKSHKTYLLHSGNSMKYFKNKGFRMKFIKSPKSSHYFRRYIRDVRPRNPFTGRGM